VEERIRLAFEEVPTALGMNNHQGSKATESLQLMKDIAGHPEIGVFPKLQNFHGNKYHN